jgi:hypothetical protein
VLARPYAHSVTWNEAGGTVSRAFADWRRADDENHAFLALSSKWSTKAYEKEWRNAEEEFSRVFDPERHYGDEHVGLFEEAVGGLWPDAYGWMVEAAALKNGVTAFEVYLERAIEEVVSSWSVTIGGQKFMPRMIAPKGLESPSWPTLVRAHSILGSTVNTTQVCWARDLRHLLTHQNGELRTEEALEKFRDESSESSADLVDRTYVGGKVRLGGPRVLTALDQLADVICRSDAYVWDYTWGDRCGDVPLEKLYEEKCLTFVPK